MPKKHPRLAFWLTVSLAALGALIAVYHLFVVARTVADPEYAPMLGGFSGGLYLVFDYFVMSLPVNLLLFAALLHLADDTLGHIVPKHGHVEDMGNFQPAAGIHNVFGHAVF